MCKRNCRNAEEQLEVEETSTYSNQDKSSVQRSSYLGLCAPRSEYDEGCDVMLCDVV